MKKGSLSSPLAPFKIIISQRSFRRLPTSTVSFHCLRLHLSVKVMGKCSHPFLRPTRARLCSALVCPVPFPAEGTLFFAALVVHCFHSLIKGRKALKEQVSHTGRCNGECTDNRPPGLTLLQRKNPSHQYSGQRSGKLCPLKRARWENDVTLKTCNPNENQIQSACSSEDLCRRKLPAQLQLPRRR